MGLTMGTGPLGKRPAEVVDVDLDGERLERGYSPFAAQVGSGAQR